MAQHGSVDRAEDSQGVDDYARFARGRLANPYPLYHRLRASDPVNWNDRAQSWVLTRYDDVRFALQYDPRLTAERLTPLLDQLPEEVRADVQALRELLATWMQYYDPPEHTRLRTLVHKAFTPRSVARLHGRIERIVDELLDAAVDGGRMELIGQFAYPLPAIVVAELLGVPPEDRDRFKRWGDDIAEFLEGVGENYPAITRRANRSVIALTEYLGGLFAERRREPREDLISALVQVSDGGDRFSEAELFGMCSFMLEAGHESTTGLIGNGLLALLRHPDQMDRLRHDPSLIQSAVEELLRYDSSIQRISRVAVRDFELRGKRIAKGARIWAMIGAANRDPAQFPDPDRLDLARENNRHVAFGYGIHHCVGAPLARLEAQIAFAALLRRLPNLRLLEQAPEWQQGVSLRALKSLRVAFDAP